jgi:hypothetical protein
MNERHPARRYRMSTRDGQMLAAAYLPIIAFGAVLIAARTSGSRRHRPQAALR